MDEVPEPEEIDQSFEPYDEDKDGRVGFQETVEVDATREWRRSKTSTRRTTRAKPRAAAEAFTEA